MKVDYIVNPRLVHAFEARRSELARAKRDTQILGFHGTSSDAIDSIVRYNFDVQKVGAASGDQVSSARVHCTALRTHSPPLWVGRVRAFTAPAFTSVNTQVTA